MATVGDRDIEIRSSELKTSLSSNDESMGKEVDTAMSKLSPSFLFIPLHALFESCSLKGKKLRGFIKRFQFPKGTVIRLPRPNEKIVLLPTVKCASTKLPSCVIFISSFIHL